MSPKYWDPSVTAHPVKQAHPTVAHPQPPRQPPASHPPALPPKAQPTSSADTKPTLTPPPPPPPPPHTTRGNDIGQVFAAIPANIRDQSFASLKPHWDAFLSQHEQAPKQHPLPPPPSPSPTPTTLASKVGSHIQLLSDRSSQEDDSLTPSLCLTPDSTPDKDKATTISASTNVNTIPPSLSQIKLPVPRGTPEQFYEIEGGSKQGSICYVHAADHAVYPMKLVGGTRMNNDSYPELQNLHKAIEEKLKTNPSGSRIKPVAKRLETDEEVYLAMSPCQKCDKEGATCFGFGIKTVHPESQEPCIQIIGACLRCVLHGATCGLIMRKPPSSRVDPNSEPTPPILTFPPFPPTPSTPPSIAETCQTERCALNDLDDRIRQAHTKTRLIRSLVGQESDVNALIDDVVGFIRYVSESYDGAQVVGKRKNDSETPQFENDEEYLRRKYSKDREDSKKSKGITRKRGDESVDDFDKLEHSPGGSRASNFSGSCGPSKSVGASGSSGTARS